MTEYKRGYVIAYTIIAILIMIVTVISFSYAYYVGNINTNNTKNLQINVPNGGTGNGSGAKCLSMTTTEFTLNPEYAVPISDQRILAKSDVLDPIFRNTFSIKNTCSYSVNVYFYAWSFSGEAYRLNYVLSPSNNSGTDSEFPYYAEWMGSSYQLIGSSSLLSGQQYETIEKTLIDAGYSITHNTQTFWVLKMLSGNGDYQTIAANTTQYFNFRQWIPLNEGCSDNSCDNAMTNRNISTVLVALTF